MLALYYPIYNKKAPNGAFLNFLLVFATQFIEINTLLLLGLFSFLVDLLLNLMLGRRTIRKI